MRDCRILEHTWAPSAGHWQPVRQGTVGHCLLYIQRTLATSQGRGSTHTGTYWGTVNLCTQRAVDDVGSLVRQAPQTGAHCQLGTGTHSGALSTVHAEGTDNQSDKGQTVTNDSRNACLSPSSLVLGITRIPQISTD